MKVLKIIDHNSQELEAYENDKGFFYIAISTQDEDHLRDQFIVLDPLDAKSLVIELEGYISRNS